MNSSLKFEFPANLTVEKFISQLNNEVNSQLIAKRKCLKIYYDSFDWRLYSYGIVCEFVKSTLTLRTIKTNVVIANVELNKVPRFSQQFEQEQLRHQLEPILEMRALLPVCTVAYKCHQLNIINEYKKTTLRLFIEEHELINHRVLLQPIKGYDSEAETVINRLSQLGLIASTEPVLLAALKQQGRKANDYSSKLAIQLNPNMRADAACKIIYSCLLKTIKANEQGTIADIDSEFLHDFRVAVRRTRSALSQLKKVLPEDISTRYNEFFSWLGQITSPTRDLDVYLLNFDQYKSSLPIEIRENLNPLYEFLLQKQQLAQQELAKNLRSTEYLTMLSEWEKTLKQPVETQPIAANAQLRIKTHADKRLWKSFKRVLHEGEAITDQSPAEDLHELRKSCKKLRYLMEFFQSLYATNKIKMLIGSLKELQEVLGDFQDCEVQEQNLGLFSEEMQAMNTPADTFLAIDNLIEHIEAHRREIRSHFAEKFAEFKQEETLATFKLLFKQR
ncbi:MAG: CHAD domain-containing protein [Methylococcaceae bacterium]|nr:CHAD domain-containing protein [Methylococcaceae bacterium]